MSGKDWGIDDPQETYWFNTRTNQVERGPQSFGVDRIGPYKTPEEAAHGQEVINERARLWREEDAEND
ncbi:hypothetical protein JOF28_000410 [Leucobacter exalbidus]|uniref:Methionine aminopeptidase n=1 Tax=Leucobacter exalbidus TaxID=662960 RepID=A0A940PLB8_9MICO|nr:methionine aminopeptidase [Leucobacter exalbidus]MBP1325178.1 hypothetical protein [Leucobacter exalbidus]